MRQRLVILPPESICSFAAKLALKTAPLSPHWYVVDNKKFQPHITLFDVEFDQKNSRSILSRIGTLIPKIEKPKVTLDGVWMNPKDGTIGIAIKETKVFLNFRKLLQELFKSEKIKVIPSTNSAHITMTKYRNIWEASTIAKNFKVPKKKFKLGRLALVNVNIHGQFKKFDKIIRV